MHSLFKTWSVIGTLVIGVLISSCQNKESTTPTQVGSPPELPPTSTLLIDFADFDTTSVPKTLSITEGMQTRQNWTWAAFNVGIWNIVITITLAPPVASFIEAFNHTPVQQPDGSWLWEYDFFVVGVRHTAKLFGSTDNNQVLWRMLISRTGAYTDFEWYTGESNLLATQGAWHLKRSPNNPTPFLDVEWERNLQNSEASVRYTNVTPGVGENGDYIFYGINSTSPYNAFYHIFDQDANNLILIEWDRAAQQKNGRIQDPRHFQDMDWHCWDTVANDLADITCP